jgi:glycosyltransferase involved in cell wall biosynthesis
MSPKGYCVNKKRILFISAYFPNPSAPNKATYIRQILIALTQHYHIDAIVPVPWYGRSKISMERTFEGIKIFYPNYFYSPLIFRSLYGHFYYQSIISTVNRLIKTADYDLVYTVWLYPDAWVAARIAKMLKLPLYAKAIGTDVNRLNPDSFLTSKLLELAEVANKIIAVSNPLRNRMIELGCNPDKVVYLQNGVDHSIFYPVNKLQVRSELGISPEEKMILFVGNLKKEKGLVELADAFAEIVKSNRYPDIKLFVIGNGRDRSDLIKRLIKHEVFNKASLLGERSLETISKYMSACDVLCLPSYMEGQPNVVIEALTCHAKVVSTKVGGIPDLDDGHGNLKLVPPCTVPELIDALTFMIDKDDYYVDSSPVYSWEEYASCLRHVFEVTSRP